MIPLLLLLGCEDREVQEWRCVAPLVELVRWRDTVEAEYRHGGRTTPPAELAALERGRVEATAATLRALRPRCDLTWNVLLFDPPDNPGLRLREEALLLALGQPPKDYGPDAVGRAGVSAAGRPPVAPP